MPMYKNKSMNTANDAPTKGTERVPNVPRQLAQQASGFILWLYTFSHPDSTTPGTYLRAGVKSNFSQKEVMLRSTVIHKAGDCCFT